MHKTYRKNKEADSDLSQPLFSYLPFIVDFFGEAVEVFEFDDGAVIEDGFTGKQTKYLILIAADNANIGIGMAVHYRLKVHFESAIGGSEFPRGKEIIFTVFLRDFKGDLIQLMSLVVIKQHIFRCGRSIAKTIANIKTKGNIIAYKTRGTSPVPSVFVGPYTSAPIKNTATLSGGKAIEFITAGNGAASRHTVDFLVIIKGFVIAGERRGNNHAFGFGAEKLNFPFDGLAVFEFIHGERKDAAVTLMFKRNDITFALGQNITTAR